MDSVIQTIINGTALGSTYALVAIGLAMVYSVLGLINFAHGELLTITGYSIVALMLGGVPFWVACLGGVIAAMVAAVVMERVAFRSLRGASLETLLLSSFAISAILQVMFTQFVSPRPVPVQGTAFLDARIAIGGVDIGVLQIITIGVTVLLLLLLTAFFRFSAWGLSMRASGVDFEMARLVGVRANAMFILAFAVSGLLAGVAGILWVGQRGAVDPEMGFAPVIAAFLATIVGGLGSIGGAALGGLVFGLLQVVLEQTLPDALQPFRGAVLVGLVAIVLVVRPDGLWPAKGVRSVREV